MKKRKFINRLINTIGIILILIGGSIVAYDFLQDYNETKKLEKDKQAIMNQIAEVEPGEQEPNTSTDTELDQKVWGLIEIDSINLSYPVVVTDDFSIMRQYLVAYKDSRLPPNKGNLSIAGHRGKCALCGFTRLVELKEGETIKIIEREYTHVYEVTKSFMVDKTETWVLDDDGDKTTLTLITCETVSKNPNRQIIRAELKESIPNKKNS